MVEPIPPLTSLRVSAFAASLVKRGRAIRDFQAECRAAASGAQRSLAPVGMYEFVRDREAEPGAAGPSRPLERLEQMRPRLIREARTCVGNLDQHHSPLAPPGDPDLIARGIVRGA